MSNESFTFAMLPQHVLAGRCSRKSSLNFRVILDNKFRHCKSGSAKDASSLQETSSGTLRKSRTLHGPCWCLPCQGLSC